MTELQTPSARRCGTCSLCCRLVPVPTLRKVGGQRCKHQRHGKGCAIYDRRPPACVVWACAWLADPERTAALQRPDRAHYVVDIMPDFVTVKTNDGSREDVALPVLQVWIDPEFPHAHRDPALRAMLEDMGAAAMIRSDEWRSFLLTPPRFSASGEWAEHRSNVTIESEDAHRARLRTMRPPEART